MKYESRDLQDSDRQAAGLSSIRLSRGTTAYELAGPEDAPVVVLLHGGTVPSFCFDEVVPAVHAAGLRTLRYDMYGRGWSDRPEGPHDAALYRTQLLELLDGLGLDQVDLVGFSFGGATATHFTAHHPERVRRLALLAPVVHFPIPPINWLMSRLPVIGPWFLGTIAIGKLVERAGALFEGASLEERYKAGFREQMVFRGWQRALLSLVRYALGRDYRPDYATVGRTDREVLLIWGTADDDIPEAHMKQVQQSISNTRFRSIPGAGHGLPMLNSDVVNEELARFLAA